MAKNPYLAALLSFILAGLGQLYVGTAKKAVIFFLFELTTTYVYFSVNETACIILNLPVTILSMADAYHTAKNTRETIKEEPDMPQQPELRVF